MERPNDEPECIEIEEAAFFMTRPSLRIKRKLDPGSALVNHEAKLAEFDQDAHPPVHPPSTISPSP